MEYRNKLFVVAVTASLAACSSTESTIAKRDSNDSLQDVTYTNPIAKSKQHWAPTNKISRGEARKAETLRKDREGIR
ncbi:hypothetical protein [Paraglaciecola sp.]|uniref:hypothetical protein n=1 Tax=Paraglaciecola sp. TaxID=1920173 RepID=UPI003EF74EBA